jgi:glutaminyl-peptide cyclotransferase
MVGAERRGLNAPCHPLDMASGASTPVRPLVIVLAIQVAIGIGLVVWGLQGFPLPGNDREEPSSTAAAAGVPRATSSRFDGAWAWGLLREQVALGPRPAGSEPSRRLAARLASLLPSGRLEAVPGAPAGMQNVVGVLPGTRPAIVVGAHYDTLDMPEFVGANDGASGVAVVVAAARALQRIRRPAGAPELRFVLFDGEEAPPGVEFLAGGVRGSKAYAREHGDDLAAIVLLDMIGDRDLSIPREESSDPALWTRLRAAARRVGTHRVFPDRTVGRILDDHTPFLQRGIPSIDLIDFTFPVWHTTRDDLRQVSARSLDAVGETVVELLRGGRLR